MFWIGRTNSDKMITDLGQSTDSVQSLSIKLPKAFFTEVELTLKLVWKKNKKLVWKQKRPQIIKNNLEKQELEESYSLTSDHTTKQQ